jgi:signal transduction histidine kinase
VAYVVSRGDEVAGEVLRRVGESRETQRLLDGELGYTYAEFRALLEATGEVCGDASLEEAGAYQFQYLATPEFVQVLRSTFGTVDRMLTELEDVGSGWHPMMRVATREHGEGDWTVVTRFDPGYGHYKAFCHYYVGLVSVPSAFFGFALADVVEEECRCEGGAECRFRVRWDVNDLQDRELRDLRLRAQLVEGRLAGLQRTVTELVGDARLETILDRVVASAGRAVSAPAYVLALEERWSEARRVYAVGLPDAVAAETARSLLLGRESLPPGILPVEVRSSLRTYGWLAAVDPSEVRTYLRDELLVLEAYASLAAAALDVATALDDARRQAKVAEEMSATLAHERSLLSAIVSGLPHGVCWTSEDGRVAGCNHALARLLAADRAAILGSPWVELSTEGPVVSRLSAWHEAVIGRGESVINDELVVGSGDDRRIALVSLVPLAPHPSGAAPGGRVTDQQLLSIWADVTEQRQLEQRITTSSRLESIGHLAAGIAHEINTPMQYIGDNGAFLGKAFGHVVPLVEQLCDLAVSPPVAQQRLDQMIEDSRFQVLRDRVPEAADQVADGVQAVSRIVAALKTFAYPGGEQLEPVDIIEVVHSTVDVSRNEWKSVAELDVEIEPGLPPVRAVQGLLNQVLLNLIVNAAHAVADEAARRSSTHRGRISIAARRADDHVELTVADNGGGIPPEIEARVYDPFFTTKEVGRGTGQGLSISRNIMARLGGSIDLLTSPDGTTFTIRTPPWTEREESSLEAANLRSG